MGADGVVLAVEHKSMPVAAVQFHPESILTAHVHGMTILENVIRHFRSKGKAGFKKKKTMI
jgi:anthranilate synthase